MKVVAVRNQWTHRWKQRHAVRSDTWCLQNAQTLMKHLTHATKANISLANHILWVELIYSFDQSLHSEQLNTKCSWRYEPVQPDWRLCEIPVPHFFRCPGTLSYKVSFVLILCAGLNMPMNRLWHVRPTEQLSCQVKFGHLVWKSFCTIVLPFVLLVLLASLTHISKETDKVGTFHSLIKNVCWLKICAKELHTVAL